MLDKEQYEIDLEIKDIQQKMMQYYDPTDILDEYYPFVSRAAHDAYLEEVNEKKQKQGDKKKP